MDEADKDLKKRVNSQKLIRMIRQEYDLIKSQKKQDMKAQKQSDKNNSSLANRMSDSSGKRRQGASNGSSSLREKLHCNHCRRDNHKKKDCRYLNQKKCTECDCFHKGDKCWVPQSSGSKRPWKGKDKEGESSNKKQKQSHSAEDSAEVNNASIHGAFVSLLAVSITGTDVNTGEDEKIEIYCHEKDPKCVDFVYSSVTTSLTDSQNEDCFEWIADSASTVHVTNRHDAFETYFPVPDITVTGIGGVQAFAVGKGTVYLYSECDGSVNTIRLSNVLHIPCNNNNLFSVLLWENAPGRSAHFEDQEVILNSNKDTTIVKGTRKDSKLYKIKFTIAPKPSNKKPIDDLICLTARLAVPWETWHKRFGHIAYSGLEKLVCLGLVDGLNVDHNLLKPDCIACTKAKLFEALYGPTSKQETKVGELMHTDLWGKYDK